MKKFLITLTLSISLGFFINQNVGAIKKLNVLLLGDSYSAGNGAGSYVEPKDCYRSQNNWASILVRDINRQGVRTDFHNHACSGAQIKHILTETKDLDLSTKTKVFSGKLSIQETQNRLENDNSCRSSFARYLNHPKFVRFDIKALAKNDVRYFSNKEGKQTKVNYICQGYITPQINFVGPETDLIMLTIGGNDLDFNGLIRKCFGPNNKECTTAIHRAEGIMGKMSDKIKNLFASIHAKAPNAKIVLLGYPHLSLKLDLPEYSNIKNIVDKIRDLSESGNKMQLQAVQEYNQTHDNQVIFIDKVQNKFAGHEPHPDIYLKNPKRWINELLDPGLDIKEWYHPNPKGQQAYADLLKQQSLQDYAKVINSASADLDIVFNIDLTGSMSDDIAKVRQEIKNIVEETNRKSNSARFAITTFYVYYPESTPIEDFAYLDIGFTNDINLLQTTLNGIDFTDTGYESNYSGIMKGLNLPWRNGVHKIVITLTDEPPENEESYTGYNEDVIIQKAFDVDPAQLYFINTGSKKNEVHYRRMADETGGEVYSTRAYLIASIINEAIDVLQEEAERLVRLEEHEENL